MRNSSQFIDSPLQRSCLHTDGHLQSAIAAGSLLDNILADSSQLNWNFWAFCLKSSPVAKHNSHYELCGTFPVLQPCPSALICPIVSIQVCQEGCLNCDDAVFLLLSGDQLCATYRLWLSSMKGAYRRVENASGMVKGCSVPVRPPLHLCLNGHCLRFQGTCQSTLLCLLCVNGIIKACRIMRSYVA
ncbi:hypothetical protein NFI96_020221 [Prochilodus magdalenae]|nr:hypothetical protein NFI96_020221 [Prochilodus magdalenae]